MAALSDAKVRNAKAIGKAYKLSDGGQLYLHVSATLGKFQRLAAVAHLEEHFAAGIGEPALANLAGRINTDMRV